MLADTGFATGTTDWIMGLIRLLRRRPTILLHDLAWVPAAVLGAFWIRNDLGWIVPADVAPMLALGAIAMPVHALTFWVFGCFRGIWQFASIPDLLRFVKAVALGAIVTAVIYLAYSPLADPPRAVLAIYPIFLLIGVVGARVSYRAATEFMGPGLAGARKRALIVGAGRAGDLLVRDLLAQGPFQPIAILDDDAGKRGHELHGVRIVGGLDRLATVAGELNIDAVLVAMPSAPRVTLESIVTVSAENGIECRTLPSLNEIAEGRVTVSSLRPVTVEDLLGRDPVELSLGEIAHFLTDKRVVVTGGGGSIGAELCRQILEFRPARLVILEQSEYALYAMQQEIARAAEDVPVESVLGDCCQPGGVRRLLERVRPQVVFHAAAYKHVPLVEENAIEGVRNNVLGTKVVADAADRAGVETFVLISTDKTVNPTNVMGASKRVAELYCRALGKHSKTQFITTRFGNVLASAGSVVPLFEDQIRRGGPVTVTHPDVTRFFMTIPEAVGLILQAAAMGKGGEIFVLDMGEPVKILHLAEKMIQLSGLQPGRDIMIEFTGLRAGEKLYEELFYQSEELRQTTHPKLMLAQGNGADLDRMKAGLVALERAVEQADPGALRTALQQLVPGFTFVTKPELKVV